MGLSLRWLFGLCKVFFPCQCCRSSWWCRPCFWWPRVLKMMMVWPAPAPSGSVCGVTVPPRGRSPVLQTQKRQKPFVPLGSKTTKSKVANKVLYLWQWENPRPNTSRRDLSVSAEPNALCCSDLLDPLRFLQNQFGTFFTTRLALSSWHCSSSKLLSNL